MPRDSRHNACTTRNRTIGIREPFPLPTGCLTPPFTGPRPLLRRTPSERAPWSLCPLERLGPVQLPVRPHSVTSSDTLNDDRNPKPLVFLVKEQPLFLQRPAPNSRARYPKDKWSPEAPAKGSMLVFARPKRCSPMRESGGNGTSHLAIFLP
jgi:hypothetical protein